MIETWILSFADQEYFRGIIITLLIIMAGTAVCHAIICKNESRSAVGWVALILSAPLIGTVTYIIFGFNRIRKKGEKLNSLVKDWDAFGSLEAISDMKQNIDHVGPILKSGDALSFSPVSKVEEVHPLNTGDEAYPRMLEAIDSAKLEIKLFSYIFTVDQVGFKFLDALERAKARGVKVYVLVDGVGSQSTLLKMRKELKRRQLNYEVFLPIIWRPWFVNLRNHRKILVIDSNMAFIGGLNIAEVYWPKLSSKEKILDFHFMLKGQIARYIEQVFNDDWLFCTENQLGHSQSIEKSNEVINDSEHFSRVIASGPGEGKEKIQWHFIAAINSARSNIRIVTPYFLPSSNIISALVAASNRGVSIDIILPSKSDHATITWAMNASMHEIMASGINIWLSPPPFDHSKMLLVDNFYCSIGSANWDVRSLRLNFEMNVEVIGLDLNNDLTKVFESKKIAASLCTSDQFTNRNLLVKLRDGIARMASPYL